MTSLVRSRWAAIGAAVAVTLGAGGLISVNASDSTSSLVPITPERILDTRSGDRVGSLDTAGASDPYRLKVTGTADIPATGVTGVSLNVTAVDTQTNDFGGFVSVYPCASVSTTKPDVSNMNFGSGQTIANAVTVPVSADGHICLYVYGTAHLLVDTNGYYTPTNATSPAVPVNRISDEQIAMLAWYDDPGRPATIGVGDGPEGLASDGTNIYAANYLGDTVSVIDPTNNTVTDTINVGDSPVEIAYTGTNLYVSNFGDGTVSVINPNTNTVTKTINVGTFPSGISYNGTNIYVANGDDDNVSVINPTNNTIIDTITVGNGPNALVFDGTNIYVTNQHDDTVSVIDPNTNQVIGSPINVGDRPRGAAFNGTNIYVTNWSGNSVSVIDPTTNTVTKTISVGDGAGGIAYDGNKIYVNNQFDDTISIINTTKNIVIDTIPTGDTPTGIVCDGTNVFIANYIDNTVLKLLPQ